MVTRRSSKEKPGKQSRVKLIESEELAQALMRSTATGVFIVQDGKFRYVNSLFLEETGYTEEELLGTHSLDLVHSEDREIVRRKAIENLKSQSSFPYEYRFMKKNGGVGWVLGRVTSAEYKGKPAAIGSFMNITERKRIEHNLNERVKELDCLYGIVRIAESPGITLDELYQEIANLVPASCQYPEIACARATIDGKEFKTANYRDSEWKQASDIKVQGAKAGSIEVGYLEKRPVIDGEPFLREERLLLDAVAERLGRITEWKWVEEALRESESKHRTLLENIPQKIFLKDRDSVYVSCNGNYARDFKIEPDEIAGKTDYDFFPKELAEKYRTDDKRLMESGKTEDIEERYIHDGREFIVHTVKTPVKHEQGNVIGLLGIFWDVTEQKRVEEALRESEEFNSSLLSNSPNPILVINPDTSVRYVNPALEGLTGFSSSELIGAKAPHPWWTEATLRKTSEDLREAMHQGVREVEELFQKRDGQQFWVEITATPANQNEQLKYYIANWVDITERKKAEERIEHLNLVLGAIRSVNQLITREKDRERLLKGICDSLIETRGYYNAWVALLDGSGRLITAAEAGLGKDFLPVVELLRSGELTVCAQRALTQADVAVINDPTSTCTNCPLAKKYSGRGAMTARVEHAGEVYGLLSASAPVNFLTDAEEISLFEEVARDIAFALYSIGLEEERKRGEEVLRESEEKLRVLFESIADGIILSDFTGTILQANDAAARLAGYSNGKELIGRNAFEFVAPKDRTLALEATRKMLQEGLVQTRTEYAVLTVDGGEVDTDSSVAVLYDGVGKPAAIINVIRDITERKRMEEGLRTKDSALASSINAVAISDLKGNLTYVNRSFLKLWRYDDDKQVLGKSSVEFWQMEERAVEVVEALRTRGNWIGELVAKRQDGSLFDVQLSASVVIDDAGAPICMMGSFLDVTERKRTEKEREALLKELEEINRKLEQSNKELQDFAYIASHDLREPLRKISSFGTLLQNSLKGKTDEDQQENFEFMIDGANRMQEMIDDLLNYSRLTTRAKPPERVDLNKVIKDLKGLELATLLDETRGSIHVPKPLPPVQGDPSQIHQFLQNLIGNGLKFHREGIAPEISIRAHRIEGNMVRVEVQDNGIGIGEEYQEQVFTMFKRLHSRAQYKGTGIGLAVCKKIVERHGGNLGIKSAPGEGSTFWFTLPRESYARGN